MAFCHGWVLTIRLRFGRLGRFSDISFTGPRVRFWLQAAVRRAAISVCLTPSTGLSGSGVIRHAIFATNAPNVRFLPIPSALPQRADVRAPTVRGRF